MHLRRNDFHSVRTIETAASAGAQLAVTVADMVAMEPGRGRKERTALGGCVGLFVATDSKRPEEDLKALREALRAELRELLRAKFTLFMGGSRSKAKKKNNNNNNKKVLTLAEQVDAFATSFPVLRLDAMKKLPGKETGKASMWEDGVDAQERDEEEQDEEGGEDFEETTKAKAKEEEKGEKEEEEDQEAEAARMPWKGMNAGQLAIIEQILCAEATYFVGTATSYYTKQITEERLMRGKAGVTTYDELCPQTEFGRKGPCSNPGPEIAQKLGDEFARQWEGLGGGEKTTTTTTTSTATKSKITNSITRGSVMRKVTRVLMDQEKKEAERMESARLEYVAREARKLAEIAERVAAGLPCEEEGWCSTNLPVGPNGELHKNCHGWITECPCTCVDTSTAATSAVESGQEEGDGSGGGAGVTAKATAVGVENEDVVGGGFSSEPSAVQIHYVIMTPPGSTTGARWADEVKQSVEETRPRGAHGATPLVETVADLIKRKGVSQGQIPGWWTYLPLLPHLSDATNENNENSGNKGAAAASTHRSTVSPWLVLVPPTVNVDDAKMRKALSTYDPSEPWFLGNALEDTQWSILHHYAEPAGFQYPDQRLGMALSGAVVDSVSAALRSSPGVSPDFHIDAPYEFAKYLNEAKSSGGEVGRNAIQLKHLPSIFCTTTTTVGPATSLCGVAPAMERWQPSPMDPHRGAGGGALEARDILVVVKTTKKNHMTRIPGIKATWLDDEVAAHTLIFSETEDDRIPVTLQAVPNTERGHAGKLQSILRQTRPLVLDPATSEMFEAGEGGGGAARAAVTKHLAAETAARGFKWLAVVDDDTLLDLNGGVLVALSAHDWRERVMVGDIYGYGHQFNAEGHRTTGYDYPTGGAGMYLSAAAVHEIVENMDGTGVRGEPHYLCEPGAADEPDDMWLGKCAQGLDVVQTQGAGMHQAHVSDYSDRRLQTGKEVGEPVVSFHRFKDVAEAVDIYQTQFGKVGKGVAAVGAQGRVEVQEEGSARREILM